MRYINLLTLLTAEWPCSTSRLDGRAECRQLVSIGF